MHPNLLMDINRTTLLYIPSCSLITHAHANIAILIMAIIVLIFGYICNNFDLYWQGIRTSLTWDNCQSSIEHFHPSWCNVLINNKRNEHHSNFSFYSFNLIIVYMTFLATLSMLPLFIWHYIMTTCSIILEEHNNITQAIMS